MNSPAGFDWNNGNPINVDPWAAMFNEAAFLQGLHMSVAAFQSVGFAVAGLHAWLGLRTRHAFHLKAVKIAFAFAAVASLVQPIVGDLSAKSVARRQPIKLAAMEALFETRTHAPLLLGGIPDLEAGRSRYALELPGLLSFLAYGKFDAQVKGLKDFPRELWPPVAIVHYAFQIMVGLGSLMALLSALGLFFLWKKPKAFNDGWFQKALILSIPLGFIALEAGWIVTEVGRQPWIIYGILKTADAVTPRPGVVYTLILYAGLYLFLCAVVTFLMWRQTLLLHRELKAGKRK